MKCPNCNNELLVTVITNDDKGESITSFYRCELCNMELNEDEVLALSENNDSNEETKEY